MNYAFFEEIGLCKIATEVIPTNVNGTYLFPEYLLGWPNCKLGVSSATPPKSHSPPRKSGKIRSVGSPQPTRCNTSCLVGRFYVGYFALVRSRGKRSIFDAQSDVASGTVHIRINGSYIDTD